MSEQTAQEKLRRIHQILDEEDDDEEIVARIREVLYGDAPAEDDKE